ncbi:prolyl aminopeptidase [Natrinema gelatinilyticum]|uniref:prolyl aminopeptidase n=1 Tax=Natrinema gelatinilyticum TaxID=2961571 RepID=UPI0020C48CEA|nr:prolyl aminopeptidase [Natrinema gelatinilyticum]
MVNLYSQEEPYNQGMLEVGNENQVHWNSYGNPDGKPALVVHGGPGSGSNPRSCQYFDPDRYKIVLFDQRGCGKSTPPASDPATDMSYNTTDHLLADMEHLRQHLDIDRWLLFGGSWGSTLLLAYAERYPERVSEIVISPVTTTRQSEIDWLYQGLYRFLPEAWEQFRAGVPDADNDEDIVAAYANLMEDSDPQVRIQAANRWCAWEDVVISHESGEDVRTYSSGSLDWRLSFVRIASHYFSHAAWLEEEQLLRNTDCLSGIPGVLVHGRLDLAGPLETAWELDRAWPDAELTVVDNSGHTGGETMGMHVRDALDSYAER